VIVVTEQPDRDLQQHSFSLTFRDRGEGIAFYIYILLRELRYWTVWESLNCQTFTKFQVITHHQNPSSFSQEPEIRANSESVEFNLCNHILFLKYPFVAYFPQVGLCDSHAVIVSVYPPINFWMPEPIIMKLGMYITAPEPISKAYFINSSHQSVCLYVYPSLVARQWIGKNVNAEMNTHSKIEEQLTRRFLCGPCRIKGERVGLPVYPSIIARQWLGKQVPAATKNC
jgi:hypothetical protein